MHLRKSLIAAMGIAVVAGSAFAAIPSVTNYITDYEIDYNTNLTDDVVHVLLEPTYVHGGATMTIENGAIIRGEAGDGTTNDYPGALIISTDGTINANGNPFNPIVFTDMSDDHNMGDNAAGQTGTGLYAQRNNKITRKWGGLLVLGDTYLAEDGFPATNQIEGLEPYGDLSRYGGTDDDDNRGTIRYVSLRYGGFVLGQSNEINGLTMGGVGRGTTIEYVEVFQNKDDGYEWFGGTVNCKYLQAWAVGDDAFDWDEGYRGKLQFLLAVKGITEDDGSLDKSDRCHESDGAHGTDSNQPSAIPTIYNATYIGHGVDGGGEGTKDLCLKLRDGTGGRWYNCLAAEFGGAIALVEGLPYRNDVISADTNSSFDAADHVITPYVTNQFYNHLMAGSMELELKHNVFYGFGYANAWGTNAPVDLTTPKDDTGGNSPWDQNDWKTYYGKDTGFDLTDAKYDNLMLTTNDASPIYIIRLQDSTYTSYSPVYYMEPRVTDRRYLNAKCQPPNDGFFRPVVFQGAFYKTLWNNWTIPAALGQLPTSPAGKYELTSSGSLTVTNDADGMIDITFDPGVFEGHVVEVTVVKRGSGGGYQSYYKIDNGEWTSSRRMYTIMAEPFVLDDIIDSADLASGERIECVIDPEPNRLVSDTQIGGWKRYTKP